MTVRRRARARPPQSPRPAGKAATVGAAGAAGAGTDVVLTVDGVPRRGVADPAERLGPFLASTLGLTGAAGVCVGACDGACAVLVNGTAVPSCQVLAVDVAGCAVVTARAVGPEAGFLTPLRPAMERFGVPQCGRCLPGILVSAAAYLGRIPNPTEDELREALAGHRCECGVFGKIVEAVLNAGVERRATRLAAPPPRE